MGNIQEEFVSEEEIELEQEGVKEVVPISDRTHETTQEVSPRKEQDEFWKAIEKDMVKRKHIADEIKSLYVKGKLTPSQYIEFRHSISYPAALDDKWGMTREEWVSLGWGIENETILEVV